MQSPSPPLGPVPSLTLLLLEESMGGPVHVVALEMLDNMPHDQARESPRHGYQYIIMLGHVSMGRGMCAPTSPCIPWAGALVSLSGLAGPSLLPGPPPLGLPRLALL